MTIKHGCARCHLMLPLTGSVRVPGGTLCPRCYGHYDRMVFLQMAMDHLNHLRKRCEAIDERDFPVAMAHKVAMARERAGIK